MSQHTDSQLRDARAQRLRIDGVVGEEVLRGFVVSDAHFRCPHRDQPPDEEIRAAASHILGRFPELDLFVDTGDGYHGDADADDQRA